MSTLEYVYAVLAFGTRFNRVPVKVIASTEAIMALAVASGRTLWARFGVNGALVDMGYTDKDINPTVESEGWVTTATPINVDGENNTDVADVLGRIVVGDPANNHNHLTIGWTHCSGWMYIYPDRNPSTWWGDWEEDDASTISHEKWLRRAKNIALRGGIPPENVVVEDDCVKVGLSR